MPYLSGGRVLAMGVAGGAVMVVVGAVAAAATPGPPVAKLIRPANRSTYLRGAAVKVSYTCSDATGGPGIASCKGTLPNGSDLATSTVGLHTFKVIAASKDGQSTTAKTRYRIVWALSAICRTDLKSVLADLKQARSLQATLKADGSSASIKTAATLEMNTLSAARAAKTALASAKSACTANDGPTVLARVQSIFNSSAPAFTGLQNINSQLTAALKSSTLKNTTVKALDWWIVEFDQNTKQWYDTYSALTPVIVS